MRLIFMGNGPFAAPALERLATTKHAIALVAARPDRPIGKRQVAEPGPVRVMAEKLGLPLEQPESVNEEAYCERLQQIAADLMVVADFGQILKPRCLAAARHGGINIHASLLPKYRGAAPIAWAIYHGEKETGVSIIQMTARLDGGGILSQRAIPIGPEQTTAEVELALADLGADMAIEAVDAIETGTARFLEQSEAAVTKAPKLTKEDGKIDWSRSGQQIHDQVRAMIPWPVAFTLLRRKKSAPGSEPIRLQLHEVAAISGMFISSPPAPGLVRMADKDRLIVEAGDGCVNIVTLQAAGKQAMKSAEFMRGRHLEPGDQFE